MLSHGGPTPGPRKPGRGVFAPSRASIHPRSANHGQNRWRRQSSRYTLCRREDSHSRAGFI